MIIIDVNFNILRKLKVETNNRFFYMNFEDRIEIYSVFNNMLFRSTYKKKDEGSDTLFFDNELKDAVGILGMSNAGENDWRNWASRIEEMLMQILEKLEAK